MQTLRKIQDVDIKGKTVLMRVDHNVVKKGKIIDPYRIDASLPTIELIIAKGAKLILMSHVGRPLNKKTGEIEISDANSTAIIVEYLKEKGLAIASIETPDHDEKGILSVPVDAIKKVFSTDNCDVVYLPNTRWFTGEESKDKIRGVLGKELAELADIFVNDAFGSWQPHASTIEPAKHLTAYAGLLMQREIKHLGNVLAPQKPFVAVIAGSKFDTKIKPLSALLKKADHLMLGGVIYNAFLCQKYGIEIRGVSEQDKLAAKEFVDLANQYPGKIIEPEFIIESDTLDGKIAGKYRTYQISKLAKGDKLNYILDIDQKSFLQPELKNVFANAGTFFVNAVMGFTPHFSEGTIALDQTIARNVKAIKLFGGGDTLQEFKTLLPDLYSSALNDEKYYFFTGGGTILKAISENSPFGLEPVKALLV